MYILFAFLFFYLTCTYFHSISSLVCIFWNMICKHSWKTFLHETTNIDLMVRAVYLTAALEPQLSFSNRCATLFSTTSIPLSPSSAHTTHHSFSPWNVGHQCQHISKYLLLCVCWVTATPAAIWPGSFSRIWTYHCHGLVSTWVMSQQIKHCWHPQTQGRITTFLFCKQIYLSSVIAWLKM